MIYLLHDIINFDLGHKDHVSIPTEKWSQIPSKLRKKIRTIERKGEGNLSGVYKQARQYVDFGKNNLKNLQKLQKLNIDGKSFTDASGIKSTKNQVFNIHDGLTHKKIPFSVKKFIGDADYDKDYAFLPLANKNNQKINSSLIKYPEDLKEYNRNLEKVADGVEGKRGYSRDQYVSLGSSIRKRFMKPEEKIITGVTTSKTLKNLIKNNKPASKNDVKAIIKDLEDLPKSRQQKKIRGLKTNNNLQDKKTRLYEKYYAEEEY